MQKPTEIELKLTFYNASDPSQFSQNESKPLVFTNSTTNVSVEYLIKLKSNSDELSLGFIETEKVIPSHSANLDDKVCFINFPMIVSTNFDQFDDVSPPDCPFFY